MRENGNVPVEVWKSLPIRSPYLRLFCTLMIRVLLWSLTAMTGRECALVFVHEPNNAD